MKYIFGIQGGKGSFNEEALAYFVAEHTISEYEVKYLYTTENVLSALERNEITHGLFAVHNSAGGIVHESMIAMGKYRFALYEEFFIEITHHLMKRRDVDIQEINTIMSHPQVLKQCSQNLQKFYPSMELVTGQGDMIDNGKIAQALAQGNIPKNYAILMSKINAEIHGFDVIKSDLQDLERNLTSFAMVTNL